MPYNSPFFGWKKLMNINFYSLTFLLFAKHITITRPANAARATSVYPTTGALPVSGIEGLLVIGLLVAGFVVEGLVVSFESSGFEGSVGSVGLVEGSLGSVVGSSVSVGISLPTALASITHVFFYCSASFDESGKVFLGSSDSDQEKQMQELEFMVKCMRDFGNADLKISFVIGFSADPAKNTAMQEKDVLINNIISFANEFGFDGVDFDYEFPITSEDYSIFSEFLVALKDKMKTDMHNKEESTISCAFGTMGAEYPAETIQAIDMVNMMTYDIFDQDGEHSSFWSCAVQGAEYLESVGFSKEQINIGIPFYGTQTDALMEQYIYKDLENTDYYSNYYSVQTYLKDGSQTEVYFNSPAIVRDKTAYALLAGYGGIMVWHGACDTDFDSPNSLWRAVDTAVEQFGGAE